MKKYKKAPLINRAIAYAIDWYISALIMALPVVIFTSIEKGDLVIENLITNLSSTHALLAYIIGIILVTIYYSYPLILKKYEGQTIGKTMLGIKVIRLDQKSLTFKDYFIRYIVSLIFIEQNLNIAGFSFRSLLSIFVPQMVVNVIYYIGIAISAVSLILMFTSKDKHMIHDILAKTEVVDAKPMKK